MKRFFERIFQKILVVSMITVLLSFFCASSVCQAKITLGKGEYYYSGTQESDIAFGKTLWQKIKELKNIANYLLGIILLVLRSFIVGYIELMEIILTALVGMKVDISAYFEEALQGKDTYSQNIVNVEKIIFNKVELFDIDIFEDPTSIKSDPLANGGIVDQPTSKQEIIKIIREAVKNWYVTLQLIVVAFMLLILIFIGIKMAIATVASDKAVYKQMLVDWVAGMIIVFTIPYIMAIIITINNNLVEAAGNADKYHDIPEPYEYGDMTDQKRKTKNATQMEMTLYESARTRAYSISPLDGFTGTIIYGALVYYAWKFALIYFKRVLNIIILTIISPIVAGTYAFNKAMSGRATIFSNWLKEYIINVIIQLFHIIIYITLVSLALKISIESLVGAAMAIILLSFMSKLSSLLREIFNVKGGTGSLFEGMAARSNFKSIRSAIKSLPNTIFGGAMGVKAAKLTARVATKPIRKTAEIGFGLAMINKANSKQYKEKKKEKHQQLKDEFEKYYYSDGVVARRNELYNQQEKLRIEKEEIKNKQEKTIADLQNAERNGNISEKERLTRVLEQQKQEEKIINRKIEENNITIDDFDESIQHEFLDYYVRSQSAMETIKSNVFDVLLDPEQYLDKEDIKFDDIEQKASEMFEDYEKYKEIIDNAKNKMKQSELRNKYEQMNWILNRRQQLIISNTQLKQDVDRLNIEKENLKIELGIASQSINEEDEDVKNKKIEIQEKEREIAEIDELIQENQQQLTELEEFAKENYAQSYIDKQQLTDELIENDINILFNQMEEEIVQLEEQINEEVQQNEVLEEEISLEVEEAYEKLQEMRNLAKEELTTYKLKKTKRKGGVDGAFWRKKESGIGKTFFENAKIENLLGLSSDEKKILKGEVEFAKSTISGVVAGITGFAILGVNPLLGMGLLAKNMNTRVDTLSRMRQIKNAPSRLKYDFKFKAFGEGSARVITEEMEREIQHAESRMTKYNVKRHPVLNKIMQATNIAVKPITVAATTFSGIATGAHVANAFPGIKKSDKNSPYISSINPTHYKRKFVEMSTLADEKLNDIYQKKVRKAIKKARKELIDLNTREIEKEYKSELRKYKKSIIEEIENMTEEELLEEEILSDDNVIKIGNTIIEFEDPDFAEIDFGEEKSANVDFYENSSTNDSTNIDNGLTNEKINYDNSTTNDATNLEEKKSDVYFGTPSVSEKKFGEKLSEEMPLSDREKYKQRVQEVVDTLSEKKVKEKIIQIAIFDLAISKKVTDITNLTIDEVDKMAIRDKIKERTERKAHLRRGDLKISKIISDNDIKETFANMKRGRKKSNDKIADKFVQKACFGYMTQNNITDPNMLKSADARAQIQSMIGSSLMTNESKSSFNVISQINNGTQPIGPELPSNLFNINERIDNTTKNIKKRTLRQVVIRLKKRFSKLQLIQRCIARREAAMKSNLKSAVYTGDESSVTDEAQLKMLFLLSEISRQNKMSQKIEAKKTKKTKKKTLDELRFEQNKIDPDNMHSEYEEGEEIMPREEELNVLLHGRRDIIDIINNG